MAIYHLSAKIVGRSGGRSAVAAAAYRSGERLYDERHERVHDYSAKRDIVHAEILLPDGAPGRSSRLAVSPTSSRRAAV